MVYKSILFLFSLSLLACSRTEKWPTDSLMYGFKDHPKKVVVYTYKQLNQKNAVWEPKDNAKYSNCLIYYYNREGNYDSMIFMFPHPSGEIIKYTMICDFDDGKKKGAKVYREGYLDEIQTFIWRDAHNYTHKGVDYKNKPVFTINVKLSDSFHEEYGETINYEESEKISRHITSTFIRDSTGWVIGKSDTDLLENTTSNYKYIHRKYDHKNTPIHSEEWLAGDTMPSKVYVREVEYY